MTKHHVSRDGGGGTSGSPAKTTRRYACAAEGCANSGTAAEMRNLPCKPAELSEVKDILTLIRCRDCASVLPEGTHAYKLSQTLNAMRKNKYARPKGHKQDEQAYLRWIKKGKHDRMIRSYAERYGALSYYGDPRVAQENGITYPEPVQLNDGVHVCGLPISCCDKRTPAARYLTVLGEVVGICRKASAIFFDVRNANRNEAQFRKLLSTDDMNEARRYAANWLRGGK